jgi:hypothetical protein
LKACEKGTILMLKGRLQVPRTFTIRQFFIRIFLYFSSEKKNKETIKIILKIPEEVLKVLIFKKFYDRERRAFESLGTKLPINKIPVAIILDIAHCFKTEQKYGSPYEYPHPLLIWDLFHNCESRIIYRMRVPSCFKPSQM